MASLVGSQTGWRGEGSAILPRSAAEAASILPRNHDYSFVECTGYLPAHGARFREAMLACDGHGQSLARELEAVARHVMVSPLFVKPMTDAVWLPGERQAMFARRLGFSQSQILRGSSTCDHPAFAAVHIARIHEG